MTRRLVALAVALLAPAAAFAQHFHHHVEAAPDDPQRKSVCDPNRFLIPDRCLPSKEKVQWTVFTPHDSEPARWCFRYGMTELYGFNYESAMRYFDRALIDDPDFAMAYWGKAMAAAPNINLAQDNECGRKAEEWSRAAQGKAAAQQGRIPPLEKELIDALAARYSTNAMDRVQAVDYAVAMRGVWARYHEDAKVAAAIPNVAAVFAEALLNLRPWALYDNAQRPAIGTQEALDVLSSVLKKPDAVGANHYWIHVVEAGPHPESAKDSADLLTRAVPSSGHLRHMPSHIYLLMGEYAKAVKANEDAVQTDIEQYRLPCEGDYATYILNKACLPLYFGHYLSHNLYFRAVAEAFEGHSAEALTDAQWAREHAQRFVANEPGLQRYMTAQLMLLVSRGQWAKVIDYPAPDKGCWSAPFEDTGCHIVHAIRHWARGVARAAAKPANVGAAREELQLFRNQRADIGKAGPTSWGNNSAVSLLAVAEEVLRARIAWAENKQAEAIEHLKLAVSHEDALLYDEPPQWMFPVRQSLGGAYLSLGKPDDGAALPVFCEDLRKHHENGRSLYGVYRSLPDGNPWKNKYHQRYLDAWVKMKADYQVTVNDLWVLDPNPPPGGEAEDGSWSEPAAAAAGTEPDDPCALVASPG